jgi:hypothetical protein
MKLSVIAVLVVFALGSWLVLRARANSTHEGVKPFAPNQSNEDPADAGKELRRMMLTMPPQDLGVSPTKEFPQVYGILMDWPIGKQTATIFSSSTGSASLYTTSTFGTIGGEGHPSVRAASAAFVKAAERFYDASASTSDYPYPAGDKVRFYLLTFQGVRVIETAMESVTRGTGPYAELFRLGQAVMTELRLATPQPK